MRLQVVVWLLRGAMETRVGWFVYCTAAVELQSRALRNSFVAANLDHDAGPVEGLKLPTVSSVL